MVEFYRKKDVRKFAELNRTFPDLYDSVGGLNYGRTFRVDNTSGTQNDYGFSSIKSGADETKGYFRTAIADRPTFGSADLKRMDGYIFVEDTLIDGGTSETPNMKMYKVKPDAVPNKLKAGTIRLEPNASRGFGHLSVISSHVDSYISDHEQFTGQDSKFQYTSTVEVQAVGRRIFRTTGSLYIEVEDAYPVARYSNKHGKKVQDYGTSLKRFRRLMGSSVTDPATGEKIKVIQVRKKVTGGKYGSYWESKSGQKKGVGSGKYKVYFKTHEVIGLIKGGSQVELDSDPDYQNQVTTGNTFFDVVKHDRELILARGSDDNKLIGSCLSRFSTDNLLNNDGQAMEMFAFWEGDNRVDNTVGTDVGDIQKLKQLYKPFSNPNPTNYEETQETFTSYGPIPFPAHMYPGALGNIPTQLYDGANTDTTTDKITDNGHGLSAGSPISFPLGLGSTTFDGAAVDTQKIYYVSATSLGTNDFKVSNDPRGGDVIDLTGSNATSQVYYGVKDTHTSDYGLHSNGTIEIDINLKNLEAALNYTDSTSKTSVIKRAFVITLGYHKPNPEDNLLEYVNKHIPYSGLSTPDGDLLHSVNTNAPFLGWSFFRTKGGHADFKDGIHVVASNKWKFNNNRDGSNHFDIYVDNTNAFNDDVGVPTGDAAGVVPADSYFTFKIATSPCTGVYGDDVNWGLFDPKTNLPLPLSAGTKEFDEYNYNGTTHFWGEHCTVPIWWTGREGCDTGGLDFWTQGADGGQDYFEGSEGATDGGGPLEAKAIWPRYLTMWLCNFPNMSSGGSTTDTFLEDDGGEVSISINSNTEYVRRPTTSSVFIDGIRLKDFNFDHANATVPDRGFKGEPIQIPNSISSLSQYILPGSTVSNNDVNFPGSTTLCFGTDEENDFYDTSYDKGIFLNDFVTDLSNNTAIPLHNIKMSMTTNYDSGRFGTSGTIFSDNITNTTDVEGGESFYGNQSRTSHLGGGTAHSAATDKCYLIDTNTASTHAVVYESGTGSVDSFTNKGFIHIKGNIETAADINDSIDNSTVELSKRELIYASARVLRVSDKAQGIYKVDTIEPFRGHSGDTFIAYLYGSAYRETGEIAGITSTDGGDANTVNTSVKLLEIIDDKHVKLEWAGESNNGYDMTSEKQLPYLMISPFKYWFFVNIQNYSLVPSASGSTGAVNVTNYASRSYDSALLTTSADGVSNIYGTFGITYNETLYNDSPTITGAYESKWSHDITDVDGILDLRDYGYGALDENELEGGFLSKTIPKINNYNNFKMDKIFQVDGTLKPGDDIDFMLVVDDSTKHEVIYHNNLASADAPTGGVSTKHDERLPYFLTVFEDELPSTPKLSVKPFKDDPFLPEITYTAEDDDLWYGIMIIDDEPINSQYHGAILHLPLNEVGNHGSKINGVGIGIGAANNTADVDVSDDQIDLNSHGFTAGTPIVIDTLTNVTGITEGIRYYVSETSLETNSFRITTDPSGAASGDVTFGGTDDTNIRFSIGNPIRNLAYLNSTDDNTSASQYANIFPGELDATGGLETPKHDIEGLGGYAYRFQSDDGDGANSIVRYDPDANNTFKDITSEMSAVVHVIPSEVGADANGGIFGSTNFILRSDTFRLLMNSSGIVTAQFYNHSGSGSHYVELKSRPIPMDGKTPTSIIMTFDKNLKQGNCKLFINGALHDVSGLRDTTGPGSGGDNWKFGDNMWLSGGAFGVGHSTDGFDGIIQEVVVYNKCIYPVSPQADKFVLTKPLQDIENGSPVSYTARLFMKDYHNISGGSTNDVATSAPITWRKAAFRLGD